MTIKRNILTGSVAILSIPIDSYLYFDCQVLYPEILMPNKKVLKSSMIFIFIYSDIGLYECRGSLDNTVSIKVDIVIEGN